jgi:hypothetical protein
MPSSETPDDAYIAEPADAGPVFDEMDGPDTWLCGHCAALIGKDMEPDAAHRLGYDFARCRRCGRLNELSA